MREKLAQEKVDLIVSIFLTEPDVKYHQIAEKVGCGLSTVKKYLADYIPPKEVNEDSEEYKEKLAWLRRNWNWDTSVVPEGKYRKVIKGQRGKLRTPTRTDGRIW